MKQFFAIVRQRMLRGMRLSGDEQATIEAVVKRIRKAIRKQKGIRLSKDAPASPRSLRTQTTSRSKR